MRIELIVPCCVMAFDTRVPTQYIQAHPQKSPEDVGVWATDYFKKLAVVDTETQDNDGTLELAVNRSFSYQRTSAYYVERSDMPPH